MLNIIKVENVTEMHVRNYGWVKVVKGTFKLTMNSNSEFTATIEDGEFDDGPGLVKGRFADIVMVKEDE